MCKMLVFLDYPKRCPQIIHGRSIAEQGGKESGQSKAAFDEYAIVKINCDCKEERIL